MSKSRALLVAVSGLVVAAIYLMHAAVEPAPAPAVSPAVAAPPVLSVRTGQSWSSLPAAEPTPPAAPKGPPPPRLGDVPGAAAPLAAQPDVATIRAHLDAAKAVVR